MDEKQGYNAARQAAITALAFMKRMERYSCWIPLDHVDSFDNIIRLIRVFENCWMELICIGHRVCELRIIVWKHSICAEWSFWSVCILFWRTRKTCILCLENGIGRREVQLEFILFPWVYQWKLILLLRSGTAHFVNKVAVVLMFMFALHFTCEFCCEKNEKKWISCEKWKVDKNCWVWKRSLWKDRNMFKERDCGQENKVNNKENQQEICWFDNKTVLWENFIVKISWVCCYCNVLVVVNKKCCKLFFLTNITRKMSSLTRNLIHEQT